MDTEAARNARESLELAFQISNILDTGLDRHTLSILIALCDRGVNPESLAALVREFASPPPPPPTPSSSSTPKATNFNPNNPPNGTSTASNHLSSSYSRLHLRP